MPEPGAPWPPDDEYRTSRREIGSSGGVCAVADRHFRGPAPRHRYVASRRGVHDGDHLAIHELIALHGHLFDSGALDRLDELFTDNVVYDVEDLGGGILHGIAAIRDAAQSLGDQNPLGHHTTNVVVESLDDDTARVRSKGIGVNLDGSVSTVSYEDVVQRTAEGWRLPDARYVLADVHCSRERTRRRQCRLARNAVR
jgi:SnoaL-like domain